MRGVVAYHTTNIYHFAPRVKVFHPIRAICLPHPVTPLCLDMLSQKLYSLLSSRVGIRQSQ